MIQFDLSIFFRWVGSTTDQFTSSVNDRIPLTLFGRPVYEYEGGGQSGTTAFATMRRTVLYENKHEYV